MPRPTSFSTVLLTLLLAAAQAAPPGLLVSYSFDTDDVATGPDTFRVFNFARGGVSLTTLYRFSGYRSVEIRDAEGDKDFPELQGYFPRRRSGRLFAHFAFMTTDPNEPLNIALAGPEWFTLRKDGIGFWLKTEAGALYHYSNKMPQRLMAVAPFVWHVVDVAYEIDAGTYDLRIYTEADRDNAVVALTGQTNAPGEAGSALDKFSFIGDTEDKSNVVYYVDDIAISIDRPVSPRPLVAPGRRKLFADRWHELQRRMRQHPHLIPATNLSDFGIRAEDVQALRRERLLGPLEEMIGGRAVEAGALEAASPRARRLLQAVGRWRDGNALLAKRQAAAALADFEAAAALVPEGRIYRLSAVLAFAALKRWADVDLRLATIYADWEGDARLAAACAMIGVARGELGDAERWLREPAELISTRLDDAAARRLWNGQAGAETIAELQNAFPLNWRQYVESWLICEQYFFVLVWQGGYARAQQYALRMAERHGALGLPAALWRERAGDAAFFARDYATALAHYEQSARERPADGGVLLKLSDVHFILGDLERERRYRELIYGSLIAR